MRSRSASAKAAAIVRNSVCDRDVSERDARILAENTLKWLCDTGYLLKTNVLDASPFSTPEARKPNLGEQFGNAVKEIGTSVGKEELKSIVKQVIELGVGAGFAGIRAHIGM
jgi:hypothetical protein